MLRVTPEIKCLMSSKFPLFDTHCHLDFERLGDPAQVLLDAKLAGVEKVMVPSVGFSNWQAVSDLSCQFDNVSYALGLHPYFSHDHKDEHLLQLEQRLSQKQASCVAVGECGLDFAIAELDKTKQLHLFESQIALAAAHHLPMVVHQRKSHQELIKRLRASQFTCGGVIHGFSGSLQQAHDWIDLGFSIGIGGTITYPRAKKTRDTVSRLPLDSVLLETDAPDMPIFGYQGQANHPKMLRFVLNEFNNLRAESKQTIAAQIWFKSNNLFSKCE